MRLVLLHILVFNLNGPLCCPEILLSFPYQLSLLFPQWLFQIITALLTSPIPTPLPLSANNLISYTSYFMEKKKEETINTIPQLNL